MNYLVHALLAGDHPDYIFGSFIADFVKGRKLDQYSEEIQKGIEIHRMIDRMTDHSQEVMELRRLFPLEYRRFSGIIIDVIFDHILIKNWALFNQKDDLKKFIIRLKGILCTREDLIPQGQANLYERMIRKEGIMVYATSDGVTFILKKITEKRKYKVDLSKAMWVYYENKKPFEETFFKIMGQLKMENYF